MVDLCWAPARQEALAHHLLLLGMLQALGNPLSCGGAKHTEPNPSAELGAASSPHCRQKWGLPVRAGLSILAQSGSSAALVKDSRFYNSGGVLMTSVISALGMGGWEKAGECDGWLGTPIWVREGKSTLLFREPSSNLKLPVYKSCR